MRGASDRGGLLSVGLRLDSDPFVQTSSRSTNALCTSPGCPCDTSALCEYLCGCL